MKSTGIILAILLAAGTVTVFAISPAQAEKFDAKSCIAKIPKTASAAEKMISKEYCKLYDGLDVTKDSKGRTIFDYKSCIANLPKEGTFTEKRTARDKCEYYEGESIVIPVVDDAMMEKQLKQMLNKYIMQDFNCDSEYQKYKILGEAKYKKWKQSQSTTRDWYCLDLFKDPLWKYKGGDRDEKIADWLAKHKKSDYKNYQK